ncbi:MAG TPA: hypothetical protein VNN73_19045 [Blastocatellia bacterium]|nr:hypothetical protein [Blastocatellia bacterium]
MVRIDRAIEEILAKRKSVSQSESLLVAVSGIDGSGKGYVSGQIVAALRQQGVSVAAVNVDGWLNLPLRRFSSERPAEHFYHDAVRFDYMFDQLILPLKRQRSINIEVDFAEETATALARSA